MGYIVFSGNYKKRHRTRFVETRRARTLQEARNAIVNTALNDDWYQILDDSSLEIIEAGEPCQLISSTGNISSCA